MFQFDAEKSVHFCDGKRRRDFLLSLQRPIARRKNRALRGRTLDAIRRTVARS